MTLTDQNVGDVLFTSQPFAHVLTGHERAERCDECFSRSDKLRKCSACKICWYCNKECQGKAWKLHQIECRCLRHVSPNIPTDSVRLMLRLIVRWKAGDHESIFEEILGQKRCFQDFESHAADIKKDMKRVEDLLGLTQTLKVFTEGVVELPSGDDILEIFGKMVINSFSIWDSSMQTIGVGVYLGASLLDHSCQPNAVVVFSGTELQVRCVEPICAIEVNKVRISYIEMLACTWERRRQLEEQYYFHCDCSRCLDRQTDAEMLAFKCGSDCSKSVCTEDMCKEVHKQVSAERRKAEELCQAVLENTTVRNTDQDERFLRECEACDKDVNDVLQEASVYRVQLAQRVMDLAIVLGQFTKALQYGARIVTPYERFYPAFHPNRGVHLMKVGKLRLYLGQLEAALCDLEKAKTTITVTHGESHDLYRDLMELMVQCTGELRTQTDGQH